MWYQNQIQSFKVLIGKHPVIAIWAISSIPVISAILALLLRGISFSLKPLRESLIGKDGIFLEGHIYQVDVNSKTVSVSWLLGGCGSYGDQDAREPLFNDKEGNCRMANRPIDVYVNGGNASNGTAWSYDPSIHPVDSATGKKLYMQALNEFQFPAMLDTGSHLKLGQDWTQEHSYPFDWYFWGVSVVLSNPSNGSEVLPIIHITPTDLANNFVPAVLSETPITQTLITLDGSSRSLVGRQVNVRFTRGATTKAFVVTLFLINWGLALFVFHITALSLVSEDVTLSDGVLVLPVTVILTIPSLRGLFPESPPFGIYIDNVGLFLQMVIVALCSISLLLKSLQRRSRSQPFPSQDLQNTQDASMGESRPGNAPIQMPLPYSQVSPKARPRQLQDQK